MDQTAELAREFERESHRIDQLIWDAMALRAGESALFCGCSNNIDWIKRAVAVGVHVSVISNETDGLAALQSIGVTVMRGSTSMLPSRDASFDAAIAFHYLHEIDPFFHANAATELGRVGKRLVIVEPAPPSDPLGLRIAALYSRAKRELGQFENYHPIDYWRKLVSIVKPEVTHHTFNFMRTPPRYALRETVALIIATMAAQETPEPYLAELRALAKRPDMQLMPQARFVLIGAIAGQVPAGAGTNYREGGAESRRLASPFPGRAASEFGAATAVPRPSRVYAQPTTEPEFPAVGAPVPATPAARPAAASKIARNAFGLPLEEARPIPPMAPSVKGDEATTPFGPPAEATDAAAEFGWEWETPTKP